MSKIQVNPELFKPFIETLGYTDQYLEGNILKLIDIDHLDKTTKTYILEAIEKYKDKQLKLGTFQNSAAQLEHLNEELQTALKKAETAKETVEGELNNLQKRVKAQLMSTAVKASLGLIGGVLLMCTGLYIMVVQLNNPEQSSIIGNLLSTIFVAVVSSSFSTIAVVMGIRESLKSSKKNNEDEL